jgi:hypothetical protein
MRTLRVRLVRKLAETIDGVDLSGRAVGEVLRLAVPQARLLIAERWAEPVQPSSRKRTLVTPEEIPQRRALPQRDAGRAECHAPSRGQPVDRFQA